MERAASALPLVAVTMGDPAGIGPEIIAMALQEPSLKDKCRLVIVGDQTAIARAFHLVGATDTLLHLKTLSRESLSGPGPYFLPASRLSEADIAFARPSPAAAAATIAFIRQAVAAAHQGLVAAVCTAPINKSVLKAAGFAFPGHTEYLQHLTGGGRVVMLLAGSRLRVSLATIHCALAEVPRLLTTELLVDTITITYQALAADFGIPRPHLAVAGLNPHAGEGGLFGDEEQRLIAPAVAYCRERGLEVSGPLPPDTIYYQASQGSYDAVVSMYHDQGLIPLKLLHFRDAVNVTLGLPIVRTSVDHGTAYDLAGTARASPASLVAAIRLAADIAGRRSRRQGSTLRE